MVGEMEEKLWDAAAILADEKKNEEAIFVINSIASHAIGRFSGKPVEVILAKDSNKELEVQRFPAIKALSRQVSELIKKQRYEEAKEKAVEYMDEIISLLASNQVEERKLRMNYLKHFIRVGDEPDKGNILWTAPTKYPIVFESASEDGISYLPASHEPMIGHSIIAATNTMAAATPSIASETSHATYTTSEAAQILHVSDQTIRRMCDAGKFPEATRTEGGHWRIPKKYFKVTLEQSKQIEKDLADIRKKSTEGGTVDEFNL